jgi:Ser/Thr protein kinase RdoA (MazF antagonist)
MADMIEALTRRAAVASAHWNLPDQTPQLLKYRENAVFKVILPNGDRAALRLHRPGYHSRQALVSELDWMADLGKCGITVPQPLPSSGGAPLVALPANGGLTLYVDLIGWVEGEPLGESGVPLMRQGRDMRDVFRAIGSEMARMHEAADRFDRPKNFERPAWDVSGLLGEAPFWGRFWDCVAVDDSDRTYLTVLRETLLIQLAGLAPAIDYGLIHADLVRENVFIQNGSVAFIDFDDCGFGFRLFDLATVLLRSRREADYDDLCASLLEGYAAFRPQMAAEFVHLPLFLLLRALTYVGWAATRQELPDNVERLKRYIADVRTLATGYR